MTLVTNLTRPLLRLAKLNQQHMEAVDKTIGLIQTLAKTSRRRTQRLTLSVFINFPHLLSKEVPISQSIRAGLAFDFPLKDLQDKDDSDEKQFKILSIR